MKIVPYKKFEGIFEQIEKNYNLTRDILNRYTPAELKNWKSLDLYFILGIDSLRDSDLPSDLLFQQYRKQILKYHPDVNKNCNEAFIAIQMAYSTLNNPVMRRKYDSIFFDEEIPEDRYYEDDEFFIIFGDAIRRNAKFSNVQPVPFLGDNNSEKEYIENFYRFWKVFDSWRSFEFLEDEDYENMNSSERRWFEKKNKNAREKRKKDDILRIKKLVEICLRRDPRVIKMKANDLNKNMAKLKINSKLITNGWTEEDIVKLSGIINKYKKGIKCDWKKVVEEFNVDNKKTEKDIMVKGNEILRMGLKK